MTQTQSPRFWNRLATWSNHTALIDSRTRETHTYRSLVEAATSAAERMRLPGKGVIFLYPENDPGGIACYLGGLIAGHAVHLSSMKIDQPGAETLAERYCPELILWKSGSAPPSIQHTYTAVASIAGYNAARRIGPDSPPPADDLAVLLSTSASTGTAKFVRLSQGAINAAAEQVISALGIGADDRAITSLPYSYVYGLSVVNSHLCAGASLVLESRTAAHQAFWETLQSTRATSLPGVSITYDFMRQLKVDAPRLPALRKLMHAGEPAKQATVTWLYEHFGARGVEIFLMYGQTEATGRISVLPPHLLPQKASSVGFPVKPGRISVSSDQEVIFSGPNVMLGYASGREDLCRGDDSLGRLCTGDLGYVDAEGLLYLTGRISRHCKILGRRMSLDDVECYFHDVCSVAAVDGGGHIVLFVEEPEETLRQRVQAFLAQARLPPQSVLVRRVSSLPRTDNGKLSYKTLASLLAGSLL
jgi:long-chain acyl-CoA synthetase